MTTGEQIKKASEGAKKSTDKVVDAIEDKINEVTDAVEGALRRAGDRIHKAAGGPESPEK